MNTMKKQHLVAGTIIGGLLLAATMHTTSTFALNDSSSDTTDPSASASQTDPTVTDAPAAPPEGAVADGSTATQSADSSVDSSQSTTSVSNPSDLTNTPSADQSAGTNNSPADPSGGSVPSTDNDSAAGNNTEVDNTVNSNAQSGDATVSDNNHGGNASSGDASGITTLLNAIASTTDLSGGLQTFLLNVGDTNGDIVLNPNQLLGGALSMPINSPGQNDVGGQNDTTINNNVNLSATSGDATVSNNRQGGNATTGDATTEADIVNLIESLINNQQAFLGVININGTLNGNILLPASVIDQLLKEKSGDGNPSDFYAANNVTVNNNVNLSAESGTASVIDNDRGGNATSGNATTKLNIYNLIDSRIVGGNVLLAFVNVMGSWYGLLMNAPAGTTSAALGGGITQDSQGDTSVPASQVFGVNNATINNNVTLTSKTGDATVSGNHHGGNATTGNASAVADIVNILGSQINLSGWLGILIINVFGTWNGSLAIQPTSSQSPGGTSGGPNHHTGGKHHNKPVVSSMGNGFAYYISYSYQDNPIIASTAHVLGDSNDSQSQGGLGGTKQVAVVYDHSKHNYKGLAGLVLGGLVIVLSSAAGVYRYLTLRRKQN